ncbi:MAG: thioesterase [Cardiobacteriales bacterium]|nr:MAG: thioesterase [Cardiobacteriales bacterium]
MNPKSYDGYTTLVVRIDDINYGGHLGHDHLVTILHQARLDFFAQLGGSELDLYGTGLIMRQLQVDYLAEAFLGDRLTIWMRIVRVKAARFTIEYLIKRDETVIAKAMTLMVSFDYQARKVIAIPQVLQQKFSELIHEREL